MTISLIRKEEIQPEESEEEKIRRRNYNEEMDNYEWLGYHIKRPKPTIPEDECCKKICRATNEYINFLEKDEEKKSREYRYEGHPFYKNLKERNRARIEIDALDKFRNHIENIKLCKCKEGFIE